MNRELQLHGAVLTHDDIKDAGFAAIERGFSRISIPPFFIPQAADTFGDNIAVASLIDFPYGMSDTKVRQHATLDAINRGAKGIDLVVNAHWLLNDKKTLVEGDIEAHKQLCDDKDVTLKVMIDYRPLRLMDLRAAFSALWNAGVTDAMVSTGHFMDDFFNQIAIINVLNTSYINKIAFTMNGTVCSKARVEQVESAGIGVRLHSAHAIRILFPAILLSTT